MPWDGDKNDYLNRMRDGNLPVRSQKYHPNPEYCCEACVFKRGPHSDWCVKENLLKYFAGWASVQNPEALDPMDTNAVELGVTQS